MRNIHRIPKLLELFRKLWSRYPDMRFNQLIYLLQSEYASPNNERGKVVQKDNEGFERTGYDLFYVENDAFIVFIKEYPANLD